MAKRPRPPRSLSVELADGRLLQAQTPARSGTPLRIRVVARIDARDFEACPICGDPATAGEHVPPLSIGGRVMTRTCGPCNNGLGSRIEADLVDWHDDAVTLPAFRGNAVQGARRASRILHRATPNGDLVLLMDESADPAVRELLLKATSTSAPTPPTPTACA